MLITAFNPGLDDLERTFLSQSYAAGTTSIEVKNNQKIANNNRILIGELGLAQSEVVTAGIPNSNGTTQPIGAMLFPHTAGTPIYVLQFDQVKFYRSITGIDGNYALLATVNIDVSNANLTTAYDDTSAESGYYYEISMYNSITTVESALSDPIPAVTGWARNQVGYTIDQILTELNDPTEENITRDEILGYMNEVNDDLQLQVSRPYRWLHTRTVIPRVAGANTVAFPTDASGNQLMWKFDRMDYHFVDNTTTPVTDTTSTVEMAPSLAYFRNRFQSNENDTSTQDDSVQVMAINDVNNEFVYYPYSATAYDDAWYLYYWSFIRSLTSEGDTLQTPTPRIYKLYVKYAYYLKRSVTEPTYLQMSDRWLAQYNLEKARLKSHDRIDQGTPRRFESEGPVRKGFRR